MMKKFKHTEKEIPIKEKQEQSVPEGGESTDAPSGEAPAGVTPATAPATAEGKCAELNDRYLRLLAEYDNYRKRTVREISDIKRTATEDLMKALLPILDNLDRATEHRKSEQSFEEYVKGIALIEDQLRAILAGAGLERMETVGTVFDPEIHDAVMQMPSDKHGPGTVIDEAEKGYMLSGKVIRHPKVIVSA
jgi:molecular chaperone GrpE